ncbi:hypothetical protein, partial [Amycolatopsis sp.]|uniref:hypothetical protein n=1 Tax=Amycolatopsis sp. TaxID=37632 RepID=UPI002D8066AB
MVTAGTVGDLDVTAEVIFPVIRPGGCRPFRYVRAATGPAGRRLPECLENPAIDWERKTMRRSIATAGVAAGCVLLSPAVASADEAYPGNPTSMEVTVSGTSVTITGTCATDDVKAEAGYDFYRGQRPVQHGVMTQNRNKHSITFTGVEPGVWYATMSCLEGGTGSWSRKFTVGMPGTPTPTKPTPKPTKPKPKPAPQVAVKPQGAPQTGGGPADDGSAAPA